jgi:hypothetical protein
VQIQVRGTFRENVWQAGLFRAASGRAFSVMTGVGMPNHANSLYAKKHRKEKGLSFFFIKFV